MTGRTRIGSVPQDAPGGDIACSTTVLAADVERTACWPRPRPATTPCGMAEIHARLDEIGAASAPARAAVDPDRPGLRRRGPVAAVRRVLRRLAHARGAGRHAVQRSRPADPRRAVQPSRPRGELWLTATCKRFRHTLLMVSHDRDLLNDVCDAHRPYRPAEARHLHRQLRQLRAHPRRAAGQRRGPAGQDRGPAQAHAGLRRPLQGQGEQGAPGAVAHEDDREAAAGRGACDRGARHASTSPRPSSSPRRS